MCLFVLFLFIFIIPGKILSINKLYLTILMRPGIRWLATRWYYNIPYQKINKMNILICSLSLFLSFCLSMCLFFQTMLRFLLNLCLRNCCWNLKKTKNQKRNKRSFCTTALVLNACRLIFFFGGIANVCGRCHIVCILHKNNIYKPM